MLPEEKQKLLNYIKTAIDLETDIETQNQIKAECTSVMEKKRPTVISQLSTVIANLEQIKQNQYMLYQQVKTIQKTASVIGNELVKIRGYTAALTELSAMNAYYNAVSACNSRIMTAYHLLS